MEVGLKMEETELSLGLGLGLLASGTEKVGADQVVMGNKKRGFAETETMVDLKLNFSNNNNKINSDDDDDAKKDRTVNNSAPLDLMKNHDKAAVKDTTVKPPAKAQVVGWPPVRSYRKNVLAVQKTSGSEAEPLGPVGGALVKVSMDGAPYLRKVDLKSYNSYQDLSDALGKMFSSFTVGNYGAQGNGMIDFMNESKLMDLLNGSDYVPTYEDKDGDWMLVGDVPWEMFVGSCKRLRIMKGKEAAGLAPRAMEKCKNRS